MVNAVFPTPPSPNTTSLYNVIFPAMLSDCLCSTTFYPVLVERTGWSTGPPQDQVKSEKPRLVTSSGRGKREIQPVQPKAVIQNGQNLSVDLDVGVPLRRAQANRCRPRGVGFKQGRVRMPVCRQLRGQLRMFPATRARLSSLTVSSLQSTFNFWGDFPFGQVVDGRRNSVSTTGVSRRTRLAVRA